MVIIIIYFNDDKIIELVKIHNWEGEGTIENPYIINNKSQFMTTQYKNVIIRLSGTKSHIVVRNYEDQEFQISCCQNIKIENSKFNVLFLGHNENPYLEIHNSLIDKLHIRECNELLVKNSKIEKLKLKDCKKIFFNNNIINRIKLSECSANIFEDNQIAEKYKNRIKKNPVGFYKTSTYIAAISLTLFIFVIIWYRYIFLFWLVNLFNILLGLILIFTGIRKWLKIKKYPPNEISLREEYKNN